MVKNPDSYKEFRKFLKDKNEKIIAVLGKDYITDLLQGRLKRSIFILTDKKLYQIGKLLKINMLNIITSSMGSKEIPTKNINEFSVLNIKSEYLNSVGGILLVICIYFENKIENMPFLLLFLCLLILFLALFLMFSKKRKKLFAVNFSACSILADVKWYSEEDIKGFQDAIAAIQDSQPIEHVKEFDFMEVEGIDKDDNLSVLKTYLKNKNEKIIAVLGREYVTPLLENRLKESILILTDKRLYQEGDAYERNRSGKIDLDGSSRIVSIKSITGHSLSKMPIFSWFSIHDLMLIIILYLLAIHWFSIILSSILLIVVVFVASFLRYRSKVFAVAFRGGSLIADKSNYSEEEIKDFQAALDKVIAVRE